MRRPSFVDGFSILLASAGPLGQGIANAVGLAASEAHLAARFNKDGHKVVDHYTYEAVSSSCWFNTSTQTLLLNLKFSILACPSSLF